ncbi:MAG: type II toxin-antitoxin system RelE/ParE family toxin [Anaerolineae bacterium]|nr:type II toxin-antitoxin system RelE/ParE family toxin [Anaerolineae bacterium]
MTDIVLSDLAVAQLKEMPPPVGRAMIEALQRLRTFPQSAPAISLEGYETYRQLNVRSFRAVYRFTEEDNLVRVYCILHARRRLPASEFLRHQVF